MILYILLFWNFLIQAAIFVGSSIVSALLNQKTVETGAVDRFEKPEGYGQNIPLGYGLISVQGIYVWAEEPTKNVAERKEGGFLGIGGTTIRETSYSGNFALLFGDVPEGYIAFLQRLTINGDAAIWEKDLDNTILDSYKGSAMEALYRNDNYDESWYSTTITEGILATPTTVTIPEAIDRTNVGTEETKTIARNLAYWANKIKFFTGDSEQTAPVWLGGKVGTQNVAAWQRFAYCTVRDFPLTQYGNSFPRIEAIVAIVPKTGNVGTAGRWDAHQYAIAGNYLGTLEKKPFAIPLSNVVKSLCMRSGLLESQIDVSDLDRVEDNKKELVRGIKIEQNGESYRDPIEELQRVYLFGCREFDGVLYFEFFKQNLELQVIEIDAIDLGVAEGDSDTIPERFADKRIQDIEIPSTLSIGYLDYDLLLDRSEARAEKEVNRRVETIDTSIVFTLSEASTSAKRLLEQVWVQREQFSFNLPPRWADTIAPNMVVSLPIFNTQYPILVQELTIGANLIVEVKGVLYDTALLSEELELVNEREPAISLDTGFVSIRYYLLDIPLISDGDTDYDIYLAAIPSTSWDYFTLRTATTIEGSYQSVGDFAEHKGAIGICTSILPYHNPYLFDRISSLTVKIEKNAATLSSLSFEDTIAFGNLALVGDELIAFQSVEDLGNGSYKLTNLARGCRGTDDRVNSHVADERFILLKAPSIGDPPQKFKGTQSLLNTTNYFKAFAYGQLESEVTTPLTFNYTGRSIKTYQPNLRSKRLGNGDLQVFYEARSRKYTDWGRIANSDTIPEIVVFLKIGNTTRFYFLDYDETIANSYIFTLAELSGLFGFSVTNATPILVEG